MSLTNLLFRVADTSTGTSAALLLLRLVAGLAFVLHGYGKILDPFGWMGPEGFPGILQALAALSEFGGGVAWMLGLLTGLASLGIAFTMAVAFSLHAFVQGDPFVATGPGMAASEPAAVYLCIAVLLLVTGPGRFSLDALIRGAAHTGSRVPADA